MQWSQFRVWKLTTNIWWIIPLSKFVGLKNYTYLSLFALVNIHWGVLIDSDNSLFRPMCIQRKTNSLIYRAAIETDFRAPVRGQTNPFTTGTMKACPARAGNWNQNEFEKTSA